jgi:hypothetical protein
VLSGKKLKAVRPSNPFSQKPTEVQTDAPKQFGIRLSEATMKLVSEIQHHRQRTNQPITLASIVEDAIQCHYNRLVNEGVIKND